ERQGGTFGVAEVGRLAPGRYREKALVTLAGLLCAACARINAEAAAIDLAGTQMDKLKHSLRHAALSGGLEQGQYAIHVVRTDRCWVAHSCFHVTSPSSVGLHQDAHTLGQRHPTLRLTV